VNVGFQVRWSSREIAIESMTFLVESPDLRLGQLVVNAVQPTAPARTYSTRRMRQFVEG